MNGHGALAAEDAAGETVAAVALAQTISADEIALYDRQIRLWGVQAQERIRSANILLVSLRALGAEIAKNLILNGIGSLTIVDSEPTTEDDLGAQYFLREGDRAVAASPRLQELNPRVAVRVDPTDIRTRDQNFYHPYDIVIACDHDFDTLSIINAACRIAQRPFYAAAIHGFYGFIFADLISHDYIITRERSNVVTTVRPETPTRSVLAVSTKKENGKNIEMVTKREIYSPLLLANTSPLPPEYLKTARKRRTVTPLLPCLRALWDFQRTYSRLPTHVHADIATFTTLATHKNAELQLEKLPSEFLRSFLQNLGSEIVPVAAFVGGRLAEDVINVLGKREQPLQNFAFFDGDGFVGQIYALHPIFPETDGNANGESDGIGGTVSVMVL
ncbi:E1 ubiquitin-activating protein aos1 [Elasticomyces elasticus]|nr:E1 ubiquitin-activating protein aos1 [Elasticomyces elasticus]